MLPIPSLNLGTDALGLGQLFSGSISGVTSATGTEECGSKPTCIAITQTCKEKNRVYNECRMAALKIKQTMADGAVRDSNKVAPANQGSKMVVFAIIGVVVLFVFIKLLKK